MIPLLLWAGGLALLIGLGGALWTISRIEGDLETRSESLLTDQGFTEVDVQFDGRDATVVAGTAAEAQQAANAIALGVEGIRTATAGAGAERSTSSQPPPTAATTNGRAERPADLSTSAPASETPAPPPTSQAEEPAPAAEVAAAPPPPTDSPASTDGFTPEVTVTAVDGRLFLRGEVQTGAQRDLLMLIARASDSIADARIAVRNVPADAGGAVAMTAIIGLVRGMATSLASGELAVGPGGVTLTGIVVDENKRSALEREIELLETRGMDVVRDLRSQENPASARQLERLVARSRVLFESKSTALTRQAEATVDDLANALSQQSGVTLVIRGHADARGDHEENLALSRRRANTVRRALAERGVPPELTRIEARGEAMPVIPNTTTEGQALNRRVDFALEGGA